MTHDRKNEWANEFLNGRMGLKDFEWLGHYITNTLTALGVPVSTSRDAAATLQVDIAELFEARAPAEWGAGEPERLDEKDRLIAITSFPGTRSESGEHCV